MKISESIFNGDTAVIPMADVQHIEKHWYAGDKDRTKDNYRGIIIVTKHTRYNLEADTWDNNIYLHGDEARSFLKCWCRYRYELESVAFSEPV